MVFSADRREIAAAVVRAVGLDDTAATVSDMDAEDLRFGCSACPHSGEMEVPPGRRSGISGAIVPSSFGLFFDGSYCDFL
jgi:hypothetical protein